MQSDPLLSTAIVVDGVPREVYDVQFVRTSHCHFRATIDGSVVGKGLFTKTSMAVTFVYVAVTYHLLYRPVRGTLNLAAREYAHAYMYMYISLR